MQDARPCCVCPQEANALLAHGKHAEARLALLRYLEGNDWDVSLHLALVRACLGLGDCHHVEAVEHARSAPHSAAAMLPNLDVSS